MMAEYVNLTLEKRKANREARLRDARLKELTEEMLQEFEDSGMVDGIIIHGYNLKPSSVLWASAKDGDYRISCQALIESGHGEYVEPRFDSRKVSKLIREYAAEGEIPEELENGLNIVEKFSISMTKARTK